MTFNILSYNSIWALADANNADFNKKLLIFFYIIPYEYSIETLADINRADFNAILCEKEMYYDNVLCLFYLQMH